MPGWIAIVLGAHGLAGCASLDSMAVAQTQRLEEGEFYAYLGAGVRQDVDRALLVPASLDPELGTTLGYGPRVAGFAPIVAAVNARLRDQGCCRYVSGAALTGSPPHVFVGSADGELAPAQAREQRLPQDRFAPMVMHVRKPSAAWSRAMADLLAREGTRHAIVVSLTVSQYPKGRDGAFRKKVVLGSGFEQPIRFLTAEDKLLEVLQLTGVLVDERGQVVRAGAEGILARDTPFVAQTVDVTRDLDDRTLAGVLTVQRRSDLPGDPLNWEVALDNLLAQLRGDRAALRVP